MSGMRSLSATFRGVSYNDTTRIDDLRADDHTRLSELMDKLVTKLASLFGLTKRDLKSIEDHKKPDGERFLEVLAEKYPTLTITEFMEILGNADEFAEIITQLNQWIGKQETSDKQLLGASISDSRFQQNFNMTLRGRQITNPSANKEEEKNTEKHMN